MSVICDMFFPELRYRTPETRKNHYISQFLIQNFTGVDNYFYEYTKKDSGNVKVKKRGSAKNTFEESGLYSQMLEDRDSVVESHICEYIKRNPDYAINKEFAVCLTLFYLFRNPLIMRAIKDYCSINFDSLINASIKNLGYEISTPYILNEARLHKEEHIQNLSEAPILSWKEGEVFKILMGNYTLIKVKNNCEKEFFLGGMPVILFAPGRGFNYMKFPLLESFTEIYFPINKTTCFILLPHASEDFIVNKKDALSHINSLSVQLSFATGNKFISAHLLSSKYFSKYNLTLDTTSNRKDKEGV